MFEFFPQFIAAEHKTELASICRLLTSYRPLLRGNNLWTTATTDSTVHRKGDHTAAKLAITVTASITSFFNLGEQ